MHREYLVELDTIGKRYSGVTALDGVSLTLRAGEVHALVGENGAGKSTLVRILTGVTQPTWGTLKIDGEQVRLASPRDARRLGISYVSQELSLLPNRSVIENVLSGQIPTRALGVLDRKKAETQFRELLALSEFRLSPNARVKSLGTSDQVLVEIMRAMAGELRVLVLDEPTTATTKDQGELILALARRLAKTGICVVLISHALEEVLAVADTITVLRDGKLVMTVAASESSRNDLISAMIGRELQDQYPAKQFGPEHAVPMLKAEGISRRPLLHNVSLTVKPGEILGVGGLIGSGRTELARCLVGADRYESGSLELDGRPVKFKSLSEAQKHGVVMVPEDRKQQGLHLEHSIERNISLPHLAKLSRFGVIKRDLVRRQTGSALSNVYVKNVSQMSPVRSLSGGNQQRVLFAKWLVYPPAVLIVDEPTRGVDVAGKRSIYELIVSVAAAGGAVIVISSEMPELIGLSHRVIVMARGRISAELVGDQITEASIAEAAFHPVGMDDEGRTEMVHGGPPRHSA